jgi:hypothetical protein
VVFIRGENERHALVIYEPGIHGRRSNSVPKRLLNLSDRLGKAWTIAGFEAVEELHPRIASFEPPNAFVHCTRRYRRDHDDGAWGQVTLEPVEAGDRHCPSSQRRYRPYPG